MCVCGGVICVCKRHPTQCQDIASSCSCGFLLHMSELGFPAGSRSRNNGHQMGTKMRIPPQHEKYLINIDAITKTMFSGNPNGNNNDNDDDDDNNNQGTGYNNYNNAGTNGQRNPGTFINGYRPGNSYRPQIPNPNAGNRIYWLGKCPIKTEISCIR